MKSKLINFCAVLLFLTLMTACGSKQSPAARIVEEYFQAIIEKNEILLESKVCPSYQMDALLDFNSFAMVETSMENFSCQTEGEYNDLVQVKCEGSIQARFGDEIRSFDLSKRIYQVIEDSGSWLICGHADVE